MRPQQQGQQVGAAALQPQLLQLYGRPSSLNVQKVLWCCEELALPFTLLHASAILGPGARSAVAAAAIAMGQPGPFCLPIVHLLTDSTGAMDAAWVCAGVVKWAAQFVVRRQSVTTSEFGRVPHDESARAHSSPALWGGTGWGNLRVLVDHALPLPQV